MITFFLANLLFGSADFALATHWYYQSVTVTSQFEVQGVQWKKSYRRCKRSSTFSWTVKPIGWHFFCTTKSWQVQCWRGRGDKILKFLGKNTIFTEHLVYLLVLILIDSLIFKDGLGEGKNGPTPPRRPLLVDRRK